MFSHVHHVTYLVWDLESVEKYFRTHFGVEPFNRETPASPKPATLSYHVGPTVLRFEEPGHEHTMEFEHLRRFGGPVISHIGLAVDALGERASQLRAEGVDFTQPEVVPSPHGGYKLIDVAPESSCGMRDQNDRWKVRKMFPETHFGIRLQLCEDAPNGEVKSNA